MDGRKGTAEPRWGWSGVELVREPSEVRDRLYSAVALLPHASSRVDQIVNQLLTLGGKYHRYLHQDEFGPRRAEQLAALRDLLQDLDGLIAQLNHLPERAREVLSCFLDSDAPRACVTQFDDAALEQLYEAASDGQRSIRGIATDLLALEYLCATTEQTRERLLTLDTNTSSDVLLDQLRPRVEPANQTAIDQVVQICARIDRMRGCFGTTCDRLESIKGPEPADSLPWLVLQLCELWTQETGLPVTNNASRQGTYRSEPHTACGRFVQAVVEILQPPTQWLADRDSSEALPVRTLVITTPQPGHRARAVVSIMRRYVADHRPAGGRRGRPPDKK